MSFLEAEVMKKAIHAAIRGAEIREEMSKTPPGGQVVAIKDIAPVTHLDEQVWEWHVIGKRRK